MNGVDLDNLIYLSVLAIAIAAWFVAEHRRNLGRMARMALAWGLIFLGMLAAYGLWEDVRSDLLPRQAVIEDGRAIEIPRGPDGHFRLTLRVDGTPVEFLVDTGATDIVLSRRDAERVGLDPERLAFLGTARTANGDVRTAFARVGEMAVGPVVFRNVPVAVTAGDMERSLLGMGYLNRLERIEISGDRMTLYP